MCHIHFQLVEDELNQEVPDHLHSMLEKESKEEAIAKHQARKEKETVIVPPTCPGKQKKYILTGMLQTPRVLF